MSWGIIITFIVIGLLFLLLEVLVIPGTTVAGIAGGALIGVGIWQAYASHGSTAGHITLGATLLATLMLLIIALKSKTWDRAKLKTEITGKSNVNMLTEGEVKIGDTGTSISRLNPMGRAKINDKYYEVYSNQGFIDQNKQIIVQKIQQSKIFVKLLNP